MADIITVKDLVEVYSDGTKAVDGISFTVQDTSLPSAFSLSAELSALGVITLIALLTMSATLYLFRKVVS